MALGGYKFAGRYCQKGSLTDQQWAKRMHETKVAAFMAANSLANAGWEYDMTGSPDGNIHCLDTVGNNYVTVFKRTNGENDYTWFALYTLAKFTWSGTNAGTVKVWLIYEDSKSAYVGYNASCFYRIGTAQISYDDNLAIDPDTKPSITPLLPMGNPGGSASDIGSGYYPPSNTSAASSTVVYIGFALKGDDVIMFLGVDGCGASYLCCSLASGHAYLSHLNSNDTAGVFAYNLQTPVTSASGYEKSTRIANISTYCIDTPLCVSVKYDGVPSWPDFLGSLPLAADTSSQNVPFQSLCVFGVPNSAGVSAKGVVRVELLAQNENSSSSPASVYSTVANGKYLTVLSSGSVLRYVSINSTAIISKYTAQYVGWDAANPDITQASSWILYDGA